MATWVLSLHQRASVLDPIVTCQAVDPVTPEPLFDRVPNVLGINVPVAEDKVDVSAVLPSAALMVTPDGV